MAEPATDHLTKASNTLMSDEPVIVIGLMVTRSKILKSDETLASDDSV